MTRSVAVTVLGLITAVALAADRRSTELLRLDCRNAASHAETTLFANGTLRVRRTVGEEDEMMLAELGPDELDAFRRQLTEPDLSKVNLKRTELGGDLVEMCDLSLALGGDELPRTFHFSRLDTLPLSLSRVLAIADRLAGEVEERAPRGRFPRDYEPRSGDVLERADGALFRVVGETADGLGVELLGVEQPLLMYVPKDALALEFIGVVERRSR